MMPPENKNTEPEIDADLAAELVALADGSLDDARRQELIARTSRSPGLEALLDEQRLALSLVQRAADAQAPATLHTSVAAIADKRRSRSWRMPRARERSHRGARRGRRIGIAGAVIASAALAAVIGLALGSGAGAPTLGEYVALGSRPATAGAPSRSPGGGSVLAVRVDGVPFPYWEDRFGWRASGARSDTVAGRPVTTVFYGNSGGGRVAYSIVGGAATAMTGLAASARGGAATWRGGVRYWAQNTGVAPTVVWMRNGHRCILSGHGLSARALLALASWSGESRLA